MQFLVSIKRKPLLAFLVFISLLGNVFLAIMYMTKRPALVNGPNGPSGPIGLNGPSGLNGPMRPNGRNNGEFGAFSARGRRARPQQQDVDEFGEPLVDYAEYPTDYMEQSSQDLAHLRAQAPQAQMGDQATLGAVTQVGPRGGRTR